MPHRFLPMLDAITMTIVSLVLPIVWTTVLSFIPSVLAILYWVQRIRKQINKDFNGSFKQWMRAFVKKN